MKIEKTLKSLKGKYNSISPGNEIKMSGWKIVEERITHEQQKSFSKFFLFRYAVIVIIVFVAAVTTSTIGIISAAKNAKPTDTLYPVKKMTDPIVNQIFPTKGYNSEEIIQVPTPKEKPTPTNSPAPTAVNKNNPESTDANKEKTEKSNDKKASETTGSNTANNSQKDENKNSDTINKTNNEVKDTIEKTSDKIKDSINSTSQTINNSLNLLH